MASALAERHAERTELALADELSDADLLDQFLHAEDVASQEAFKALVERHGPMVLGVCRHVLGQHHDAEDAFQATFLVLARKGASIRNRTVLAAWLHEVAHRIAVKAHAGLVRRRTLERQGLAMSAPTIEQSNQNETAAWNELRPILHAEVERLPERYRVPVILSYLEGKTNEEVASLLRWPIGTVKGRLSRARDLLRSRLMRRGMTLSAAFLLTALSHGTVFAEALPADLLKRTVRLAGKFGPRSWQPDSAGPRPDHAVDPSVTLSNETLNSPRQTPLRFTRRIFALLMFAILVFSIATGIGMSVFNPGGFAPLHSALSALAPRASVAPAPSCH